LSTNTGYLMRQFITCAVLLALAGPAAAAPQSSCAGKFVGEWRHTGENKGTLTADGRAICTEHFGCEQGTWTCSGNTMTYTNSMGTWDYTLQGMVARCQQTGVPQSRLV